MFPCGLILIFAFLVCHSHCFAISANFTNGCVFWLALASMAQQETIKAENKSCATGQSPVESKTAKEGACCSALASFLLDDDKRRRLPEVLQNEILAFLQLEDLGSLHWASKQFAARVRSSLAARSSLHCNTLPLWYRNSAHRFAAGLAIKCCRSLRTIVVLPILRQIPGPRYTYMYRNKDFLARPRMWLAQMIQSNQTTLRAASVGPIWSTEAVEAGWWFALSAF